jgi:hypothetical protein
LPIGSYVALKMFDVFEREVATLLKEKKETGNYLVGWNAE